MDSETDRPAFNPGQLEECDDATEELNIIVFNGDDHSIVQLGQLGSVQALFNMKVYKITLNELCLIISI